MKTDNKPKWGKAPAALVAERASQCRRRVAEDFSVLADALRERFGGSLDALLLYGSCLGADGVPIWGTLPRRD